MQFIRERFNPISYGTMILLVCAAHMFVLHSVFSVPWSIAPWLLVFFACFFFKLRCYDEIKDFEHDKIHNPSRPLARGLLTTKNMAWAIILCWILETLAIAAINPNALMFVFPVMCYTLLMYKEFFLGNLLRPHLTTYALLHTFVFFLLSVAILKGIPSQIKIDEQNTITLYEIALLALPHWFLFNLFEFARKTFALEEERENVESYSKIFGRKGAVILSTSQIFLAALCFQIQNNSTVKNAAILNSISFGCVVFLFASGGTYDYLNTQKSSKMFRKVSEILIVVFYIIYCIRHF
jgi:4-hydroxybenzoate polyprenyltransferase